MAARNHTDSIRCSASAQVSYVLAARLIPLPFYDSKKRIPRGLPV